MAQDHLQASKLSEAPIKKRTKKIRWIISLEEIEIRRLKGICVFCDEPETPDHYLRHKNAGLFMIKSDEDQLSYGKELVESEVESDSFLKSDLVQERNLIQGIDSVVNEEVPEVIKEKHEEDRGTTYLMPQPSLNKSEDSKNEVSLSLLEQNHRIDDEVEFVLLKNNILQPLSDDSCCDQVGGIWSAPEVEQAYILDMDVVGKLTQNSVESVDFVAHKMFDQLFLKTESKRKHKRYQKNWKFKYKHKQSLRMVRLILRSRKITFKESKKESGLIDCETWLKNNGWLCWVGLLSSIYKKTSLLNWKEVLVGYRENFSFRDTKEHGIGCSCDMFGDVVAESHNTKARYAHDLVITVMMDALADEQVELRLVDSKETMINCNTRYLHCRRFKFGGKVKSNKRAGCISHMLQLRVLTLWKSQFVLLVDDVERIMEKLMNDSNCIQLMLLIRSQSSRGSVFLSFVLGCMVEDKLQHLCTEMWLMGTARWRCEYTHRLKGFYDENMMFTENVRLEHIAEIVSYWTVIQLTSWHLNEKGRVIDLADRLQKRDVIRARCSAEKIFLEAVLWWSVNIMCFMRKELTRRSWNEHAIQSNGSHVWHRWKNKSDSDIEEMTTKTKCLHYQFEKRHMNRMKDQRETKQEKLLKSWRFKFRGFTVRVSRLGSIDDVNNKPKLCGQSFSNRGDLLQEKQPLGHVIIK